MIDLDDFDAQLERALADDVRAHRALGSPRPVPRAAMPTSTAVLDLDLPPAPVPPPAPVVSSPRPRSDRSTARHRAPRPSPSPAPSLAPPEAVWEELDIVEHGGAVVDLVRQAKLAEADLHIAAHADLAGAGGVHHRDAVGWAVMRALLDGRERAARTGLDGADPDPESQERHWVQRLAVASTWGDVDERYEVLDHARERAYGLGDLAWQGRLTLLVARLGRDGEAVRELDATIGSVTNPSTVDATWLDLATDVAEATAVLGDAKRAAVAFEVLAGARPTPVAVAGRAWVCKGSVDRYRALAAGTAGRLDDSDRYFRAAAEIHRRLGAEVLLARTLTEWGHTLAGHDPGRSAQLVRQGAEIADRLHLSNGGDPAVPAPRAQAS